VVLVVEVEAPEFIEVHLVAVTVTMEQQRFVPLALQIQVAVAVAQDLPLHQVLQAVQVTQ
jgi:hypothetical protein